MARPTTIFNYIQHDPMLEWLVEVDPESGQYMPWLAESWQVAPDGRSWTMKLQKGVQYHPTVQCVYRGHRRSQDRRRLAVPRLGWGRYRAYLADSGVQASDTLSVAMALWSSPPG